MDAWLIFIGLAALVIFALRLDQRFMERRARRKHERMHGTAKMDPKVLNCLVEQQARIDLCMTSIRILLKTHPQKGDVAVLLRAATTHLSESSARETPNTHEVYERTLRNALKALVGEQ
ncbi:hypothetical protein [Burkholderia thailandensis]|uniref:hypothetical protein n=1 Tax=Burkholderia thailandensis TaxID=57975 RepID=UPI00107ED463|nr:hypothetical protein [Burkholderia thailandensis]TGB34379.1 hypothetical protein C6946_07050 [Burkholderia thailandensis]